MAKVLITGIAGGFGRLTALALLAKGHEVGGSVRSRAGRNAATVAELEAAGARIVEMDVTDSASTDVGVAQAIEVLGGLTAMAAAGLAQMLDSMPQQRPERIAEAVVALLEKPFGKKPFRTVVDHTGVGPEIVRYNDVLHDVTRRVLTNFGIAEMLDLNA